MCKFTLLQVKLKGRGRCLGRKSSTSQISYAQNGIPIMNKDDVMQKNSMLALFNHFKFLALGLQLSCVPCQSSWIHSQGQPSGLWNTFLIFQEIWGRCDLPNLNVNFKTRFILPMTQLPLEIFYSIQVLFAASPTEHLLFLYLRSVQKTLHLTIHSFLPW